MKKLIIAVSLLTTTFTANAQMTLDHSFSSSYQPGYQNVEVVNLSVSGKKILFLTSNTTLSFYNLDYSIWKTITLPSISPFGNAGIGGTNLQLGTGGTVMYPSEELFNTDPLLEVAVYYGNTNSTGSAAIFIINETGAVVDSIKNVAWVGSLWSPMMIYGTATSTFKALVGNGTGVSIYSLPGTIPCDVCGNGLGLGKVNPKSGGISDPMPNPSSEQTKITFTLPVDAKQGEITVYNTSGQLLKTYKVDNTFGYITIDNSVLPAGMYYYNLTVDGNITSTKKMLVIK